MTSPSTFSDRPQGPPNGLPPAVKVGIDASAELPLRRPPLRDDCVLHGGPLVPEEPNIVIFQDAARQIQAHCASDTTVEVGGVLLGHVYQHNHQIFVEIHAALPAINADHGPVHFTFTADVWRQIQRDMAAYPQYEVVGWFHTHPDLGVFFSADDEVVHAAAFTQPWHVGLVVDPVANQASFFGWVNGQIVAIDGFYELIPAEEDGAELPRAVIDWQITVDERFMRSYADLLAYPEPRPAARRVPVVDPMVTLVLAVIGCITGVAALILVLLRT